MPKDSLQVVLILL